MSDYKVPEESAPALKEPKAAKNASFAKAERERKKFNDDANATGKSNKALREDATGAESDASKRDGGKKAGSSRKARSTKAR